MATRDSVSSRAQADVRLAWIIVGASGLVTLTLAVLLGAWAFQQAKRSVEAGIAQGRLDARRQPPMSTVPIAPPPPNTARPIGEVAAWVGTDDYPPGAIRAGEEGRVRVTLAIDAAGKPTGCAVALSSGSLSLDNGTCLVMMRNGRFDRAKPGQVGARPGEVRRWTSPSIRWQLPR